MDPHWTLTRVRLSKSQDNSKYKVCLKVRLKVSSLPHFQHLCYSCLPTNRWQMFCLFLCLCCIEFEACSAEETQPDRGDVGNDQRQHLLLNSVCCVAPSVTSETSTQMSHCNVPSLCDGCVCYLIIEQAISLDRVPLQSIF